MADDKGDEGELQGNSEFLPFQKADNDDNVPDTVEVVALDAEPTVEEAQPTIAETLTATARAAYATASSLVESVANDTPPPPVDLDETPPPRYSRETLPRKPQRVSGSKGVSGGTSVTMFFGAGLPIILSSIEGFGGRMHQASSMGVGPSGSNSSSLVSESLHAS